MIAFRIIEYVDLEIQHTNIGPAVTVNGNSKVKSFDVDGINPQTVDRTSSQDVGVIESVATFPNTEVNVGDCTGLAF